MIGIQLQMPSAPARIGEPVQNRQVGVKSASGLQPGSAVEPYTAAMQLLFPDQHHFTNFVMQLQIICLPMLAQRLAVLG